MRQRAAVVELQPERRFENAFEGEVQRKVPLRLKVTWDKLNRECNCVRTALTSAALALVLLSRCYWINLIWLS